MRNALLIFLIAIVFVIVGAGCGGKVLSTSEASQLKLVGFTNPPRPYGAILIDSRYKPNRQYLLQVGASSNDVEVLEIDFENRAAYIRIGNRKEWLR